MTDRKVPLEQYLSIILKLTFIVPSFNYHSFEDERVSSFLASFRYWPKLSPRMKTKEIKCSRDGKGFKSMGERERAMLLQEVEEVNLVTKLENDLVEPSCKRKRM